ncbi:uncharacterized protein LOC109850119 [Asparagus officinalis]|uniref:uncharacterized protein LOC109850119 n=1 Tax=Asparagus officinalis TaxID=4686 RepID=UPI00098E8320|nr:uncharacterized protein LOC109850119 [Asparagus officinalis]
MDCFMQQMCDALHDGSLGIDLNIDLEQVNSVEPTIPYSDVAMEKPVEDGAYHDVGFEERGCAPVPSFSKPDAGLLTDMLAEQTARGTVRPPFESDSFTAPVIGINPISIPGISSLPRSDGLACMHTILDVTLLFIHFFF